ncbi:acetyl-CoA carboxylase biotin carboxyl carrier protein subunit [Sediminitomix flava]|uniref:Biotin carboxyl carrier protein n=1 Tax=Sediminitomix flava TaxID=379075 RepID=A0A315ZAK0_SEDFL|nr:acetyl-CoA carboxylase biotin carboxyl carrier protein subunit [Sediminitomix flava]PWJ42571.1 biotin carboxyl carrier protein [Sediminitomix flava]
MLTITTQNNNTFEVDSQNGQTLINSEILDWDVQKIKENSYHILYKNKGYHVDVVKTDWNENSVTLLVNNREYTLNITTEMDQLLKKMGLNSTQSKRVKNLKAPMPGLILEIAVEEGQEVKKGEKLLILEAMKMENVIKASSDVTVTKILLSEGDNVEKNQVLIDFE